MQGVTEGVTDIGSVYRLPESWLRLPADEWILRKAIERLFDAGEPPCCFICGLPFETPAEVHLDHDHATGIPRGLLCRPCNIGLAMFQEHPATLAKAALYLEGGAAARHAGQHLFEGADGRD